MRRIIPILVGLTLLGGLILALMSHAGRESRVDRAIREETLLLGNGTELETLDPHLSTGNPERQVTSALFEGLVAYHPEDDFGTSPGAAARWEHEELKNWTFYLQEKGTWSDGTPVTAQDFVYAFQRILSPKLASGYAEMLYVMKNAEAFNRGEIQDFQEVGVKALDDKTLRIELNHPVSYFLSLIKHHSWYPVPRHVVEAHGGMLDRFVEWTKPGNMVSNGPYALERWRFTHSLEVRKNPHYWDKDQVKIQKIIYYPITNESTEERAFRNGQLHVTNTLPLDRLPWYQENGKDKLRSSTQLAVYYYRLNTTRAPLNQVKVRQALSLALDRESLIRHVLRGGQRPAIGFTPTSSEGYQGPHATKFDPVKARELLAEAGFPGGKGFPKFEILINTMEAHRRIAEAIQSMWKEHLGIEINIINKDWQVYLEEQKTMKYDISRSAWIGDYLDPMTFLSMWVKDGGNNLSGWSNPEYDQRLKESMEVGNIEERFALLKLAETLLMEEMPVIPIYWYERSALIDPRLGGFRESLLEDRPYKHFFFKKP